MKLSCSLFLTLAQSFTLPALAAVEMVWERLPGHAKDIGVGADGSAWIIGSANRNGIAYRWGGTNWVATDGSGVFIAVGPAGDPWVVDIDSKLRHRMNDQWVLITEHGSATEVGVGADGTVLIAGGNSCYCGPVFNQKLYRYDPVLGFILLTGQGVVIQPDATGRWVINDQGELFHAQGDADYVKIPAHARDISVAANGATWIVGGGAFEAGNDLVYRWNGVQFELATGGTGRRISVGPDGTPWILNANDEIFRGHFLQLKAQNIAVTNGAVLRFPVSLSYPPDRLVSASYQIRDPNAVVVSSGVVAFSLGITNVTVNQPTTSSNAVAGPLGTYRLTLSNPVGADLVQPEASGTVVGTTSTPITLVATRGAGGGLVVRCPSQTGFYYLLQRRAEVTGGEGWMGVVGVAGTGSQIELDDGAPLTGQGFYRVRVTTGSTP